MSDSVDVESFEMGFKDGVEQERRRIKKSLHKQLGKHTDDRALQDAIYYGIMDLINRKETTR